MKHDDVLAARIVDFLQEIIEVDPEGVSALVAARVSCSEAMRDHPSVQVDGESMTWGLMGFLNGLAGPLEDSYGAVSVIVDDAGKVLGAKLLTPEDRRPRP